MTLLANLSERLPERYYAAPHVEFLEVEVLG
jgi:hypothetical protein